MSVTSLVLIKQRLATLFLAFVMDEKRVWKYTSVMFALAMLFTLAALVIIKNNFDAAYWVTGEYAGKRRRGIVLFFVWLGCAWWAKRKAAACGQGDITDPDTTIKRCAFAAMCLVTAVVAIYWTSLVIFPSPAVLQIKFFVHGFRDKRWVYMGFLLVVALVVMHQFLLRYLRIQAALPDLQAATIEGYAPPATRRIIAKTVCAFLGACVLSLWVSAQYIDNPTTMGRSIELHEVFHLSFIEALSQGKLPMVEARTLYGIGWLQLTQFLMQHSDYSLLGFRYAHQVATLFSLFFFFFLLLLAFRPLVSLWLIILMLGFWSGNSLSFPYTYFGWAYLPRWLGIAFIALSIPFVLKIHKKLYAFLYLLFLGAISGFFFWMSQENTAGSLFVVVAFMGICCALGRLKPLQASSWLGTYAISSILVSLYLTSLSVGWENVTEVLRIGNHHASLVSHGLSNIPWHVGRNPIWLTILYFLSPLLALVLCWRVLQHVPRSFFHAQFLALLLGWVFVIALSMLRADYSQLSGKQFLFAPLMFGLLAVKPSLLFSTAIYPTAVKDYFKHHQRKLNRISSLLVIVFILLFTPFSVTPASFATKTNLIAHYTTFFNHFQRAPIPYTKPKTIAARMGFKPPQYCYENSHSCEFYEWLFTRIRPVVKNRPLTIFGMTGEVHFLGGFKIGSFYESFMTVPLASHRSWNEWLKSVEQNAQCLLHPSGSWEELPGGRSWGGSLRCRKSLRYCAARENWKNSKSPLIQKHCAHAINR